MSQPDSVTDDAPVRPVGFQLGARLQRNMWLFALVGSAFVVGAPLTRLLQSYRGVVLELQDDRMHLAFDDLPPRWLPAIDASLGSIVQKERGEWSAAVVEARGRDVRLKQLFDRFSSTYDAVIVRIDPPLSPGAPSIAVADTPTGKRLRVPLWAEQLAGAAVGRHLRKLPESWDPLLIDEGSP